MFDLNDAIGKWRRTLEEGGIVRGEALDELESHLRDEVDHLVRSGLAAGGAFQQAVDRLGEADDLTEEFSKVSDAGSRLMELVNGEVLSMNAQGMFRSNWFTVLLLFIGFSGIFGWLGTTWWVVEGIKFRGTDFWQAVRIIGNCSLCSSFFLIFALLGLPWGFGLLRRSGRKGRLVLRSLIPALVLSPLYVLIGMGIIMLAPFVYGGVHATITGPNIVRSAISPDGQFEAYVEEGPSIDPPNQSLWVQRSDDIRFMLIAGLPEDIDSIQEIRWSPYSDIVVFHTRHSLIAVALPDYNMVKIRLGPEWRRHKPGKRSTFTSNGPHLEVATIEFPKPGAFSYRLVGSEEFRTIDIGSF